MAEEKTDWAQYSSGKYFDSFLAGRGDNSLKLIQTGFPLLDDKLSGGLWPGLTVIGAIPSLGKSTFMLQIAENISATGIPVLYFSLEMPGDYICAKSISRNLFCLENSVNENYSSLKGENTKPSIQAVDIIKASSSEDLVKKYSSKLPDVNIHSDYTASVKRAKERNSNIYIHDRSVTTDAVRLTAKRIDGLVREFTADGHAKDTTGPVVIVDYLQLLMPTETFKGTDKQQIDECVNIFSTLSRNLEIPIVLISSLRRTAYNEKVTMDSMKESGDIEYAADTILGLSFQRTNEDDFNIDVEKAKIPRKLEATVLKQRYGESGNSATVFFDYYSRYDCFLEDGSGNASGPKKRRSKKGRAITSTTADETITADEEKTAEFESAFAEKDKTKPHLKNNPIRQF